MENSTNLFPQRLKNLRKARNIYQKELAAAIGVKPGTVAAWEAGHRVPELGLATKLADFFNVSVDYLLGRTDDPRPVDKIISPESGAGTKRTLKDKIFDTTYTPTEVDLEELLEVANIRFMGERMAREDREKLLQIAKIIWEERRKIREQKGK
ncbi:MAG: helix-turn-helix transcriptional regulator [Thermoanaerobacter sp.]|nr:helix-turn-helix transcriptional regulator [Thermoanaerobacter sp.]